MRTKKVKSDDFELPPTAKEFDEITDSIEEEDCNMSDEQIAELDAVDDNDNLPPKSDVIYHDEIKVKMIDGKLTKVDEPIESDEQLPLIEDTNDNTTTNIDSVEVDETDKLKFTVAQLEMKNMELESQILEQKYQRKADAANHFIKDLKAKYGVPDNWKYNPVAGILIKS